MFNEFTNGDNEFIIDFENFYGSGWSNIIGKIIQDKIKPDTFIKKNIELGLNYSEIEFEIKKENISFLIHLDDESGTYLLASDEITQNAKEKLRSWVKIIIEESKK